ncbi:MAG: GtrA family protein [Pseudomonadota bacterium]
MQTSTEQNQTHQVPRELLLFGTIGTLGFLVDAATLYAVKGITPNLYIGRMISYFVAATVTWYCNRRLTFRSRSRNLAREWFVFICANSVGGVANYSTFAALVASVETARSYPVLAVGAGSLVGMVFNFVASKYVVFKRP